GYPQEKPTVSVRSESLSQDTLLAVTETIQSETSGQADCRGMIQVLIDFASSQLAVAGLRPNKTHKVNGDTDLCDKGNKKKNKQRRKQKGGDKKLGDDDEGANEKLPPMKTASDVVNRIIWDDGLEKDDFIVGYFDRFRGLIERSFSAFSWEDLASVDYDVLAVPRHRIQYFKYKDVKVWDKPRRLDNVFGSAKGTKTIDVVIREIEERDGAAGSSSLPAKEEKPARSDDSLSSDYDDDDSDSDDDGITVTIGTTAGIGVASQGSQVKSTEKSVGKSSEHHEEAKETEEEEVGTLLATSDSYSSWSRDQTGSVA
ncbi:leukocyte receptor cluster member 9-like, partial [Elysia marginata]